MKALISGQAGLVVMLGDDPVAHPIVGGSAISDPYLIARSLDGCSDVEIVDVVSLDEARRIGLASHEASEKQAREFLAAAGFDAAKPVEARDPARVEDAPMREAPIPIEAARKARQAEAGRSQKPVPSTKDAFSYPQIRAKRFFKPWPGQLYARSSNLAIVHDPRHEERLATVKRHSAEAEIEFLTNRIASLSGQARMPGKGVQVRRMLLKLKAQRRSLLNFLKRKDEDRYRALVAQLGIRR